MELTDFQLDIIKELVNIGVGKASSLLNEIVKHHILLKVPVAKIISNENDMKDELKNYDENISSIRLKFKGGFSGSSILIFSSKNASKLIDIVTDDIAQNYDFDSIRIGVLTEIGNILINAIVGSISNILNKYIKYSIPFYNESKISNIYELVKISIANKSDIIFIRSTFIIKDLEIKGDIILIFELDSLKNLIEEIEKKM
ncbi:MAG: hypothetical protein A2086_05625 [Spirochaetes bacterium GWD1_27_9]|nr:MAG: hypothetical protein A2Z98_06735 [Spirochaetes bacterium GWB1_27_13]OHD26177.1 MAG: hypothetical protein A2Y34_08740 [Spirochaetes bacterium GWC1_27_15]OHD37619.1 MAG: hypothetical protein A2086_05625 [Spirochaetes bacterium GWD1_27_9]